MDALTDGSYHAKMTDSELAFWLVEDAKKLTGKPGMNSVQSSMRQAASRLDPESTPWLERSTPAPVTVEDVARVSDGGASGTTDARRSGQ